jgi:NAD(P)-dependent dehydrogenase (short-subunit alcohol dehydrogenase family)
MNVNHDRESASPGFTRILTRARGLLDISPLGSFDRIGFERHALGFDPGDLDVDLRGRRCLVTGANSGIGYATARALAARGAQVVLLCRNPERGEAAARSIQKETGHTQVESFRLDVLVNNAGQLPDVRMESADSLEMTFATHVAGPHQLTRGLRPALEQSRGARVIWVSSGGMLTQRLHTLDPQWRRRPYDGVVAYAETKRAQVVLSELWAHRLRFTRVESYSMHPGWADTPAVARSLPRFHRVTEAILRTPAQGADTVVWLAASDAARGASGRFFFDREPARTHWVPWTRETESERHTLWEICENPERHGNPSAQ